LAFAVCHGAELCQIRTRRFPQNQKLFLPKIRAAQIARPGGAFEIVEREIPQPAAGWAAHSP